jgi:aspartyl-tRNA(Asn)/glutamyl-tRNA(Gln) amidotransferase subunit C
MKRPEKSFGSAEKCNLATDSTFSKATGIILGWFSQFVHSRREPPMALTREQIASIAALARLDLSASEIPVYQDSLSRILDFVSALDACPTADVAPMAHPLPGLTQRLRPDVITERDRHEQYQLNAPLTAAGLYLVPKVIE